MLHIKIYIGGLGEDELRNEERSCSGVWWYSSGYFCIACQTAARWTGCCWGRYCLLASSGLYTGTSPHWYHWCLGDEYLWCSGSFNHPLQSPPVLGHAHPMPVCNVSSQDTYIFAHWRAYSGVRVHVYSTLQPPPQYNLNIEHVIEVKLFIYRLVVRNVFRCCCSSFWLFSANLILFLSLHQV